MGGQGSNAINQFSEKTNIDVGDGSFSISPEEHLTNNGFEENTNSWNFEAGNPISFGSKNSYSTGTNPQNNFLGDLDGDGDLDYISANYNANTISVLKNIGNGSFSTKTDYGVGTKPYDIKAKDLDGDGDLDAVTTNLLGHNVSVIKNNGNGTFSAKTDYSTGNYPQIVTLGDLDGDGDIDITTTNYFVDTLSVLKNNGDGTFAAKTDYIAGSSPRFLTNADLDGDGDLDLAVANYGTGSISIFKNNGNGTFAARVDYAAGGAYGINAADLDGDGDLDLAVSNYTTAATISVLMNNGNGTFAARTPYTVGNTPETVSIGDIDLDGHLDIVTNNQNSSTTSILRNNGNGTFAAKVDLATGSASVNPQLSDVDDDGDLDLVTSEYNNNLLSIFMNIRDTFIRSTQQSQNSAASGRIDTTSIGRLTQSKNLGNTNQHILEAYVYTNGSAVTSNDASLYVGSSTVTTNYTDVGSGWYKLQSTVTGTTTEKKYGLQVGANKTVYVDNLSLKTYGSGTLVSGIMDTDHGSAWGNLAYVKSGAGSASVKVRSSNNADMSGTPAFAGCAPVTSGTDITGQSCVTENHRYIQYEVTLVGEDGQTPLFEDISVEYSPYDNVAPETNASDISMKKSAGGDNITENSWTNGNSPFFEWTAGEDIGTGIKGYCLYLGTDQTADPVMTKGSLGTSPLDTSGSCPYAVGTNYIDTAVSGYLGSALISSSDAYYLRIKAIDNAHNIYDEDSAQFHFRFDNTPPNNPDYITAPSQFVGNKEVTLTWPTAGSNAASDNHSGLEGLQYRIGNNGTWYGESHNGNQDTSDLLANDGTYITVDPEDYDAIIEGNNVVFFRTWDGAGNVSTTYVTTVIKFNSSAASSPLNVTATPSNSSANSFAFSWVQPASFQGDSNNLTYCYTINTLPSSNTCNWTEPGATNLVAGPYATQPGENTFYVVARDETMAVNYATAASTTFTANTSAPGIPQDIEIADVSTRATSTWRLALSWSAPQNTGVGVANYRLSRSTDGINFSQVASTAGNSHVEGGLTQADYYYKVRACDSANNCGAYSSIVSMTPTGRYTEPANLISQPSTTVSTRNANITWVTDRNSDSRIQYGTSSGKYFTTEAAASLQTKNHGIELSNLDAGTTYYYRARWTDEDGNVGTSGELSFTTMPAPSIQEVSVKRVTMTTAIIEFTSDNASNVKLYYGKSAAFGGLHTVNTSLTNSTYTVELSGLEDGTKYYFGINPVDNDGNEYKVPRIDNFSTPARPKISNLRFQPVAGEPTSTQEVTWNTNVPASSLIRFTTASKPKHEQNDSTLTLDHKMVIRGLEDDTEYSLAVESRDGDGNLAISDSHVLRTQLDTRPPKISNLKVVSSIKGSGAEARGQVIVSWTTDELASSQVAYGKGSNLKVLNNKSSEDLERVLEHIVIISDLSTSSVYTIAPISSDRSNNKSTGTLKSAIVSRASDNLVTIVINTLQKVFGF